MAKNDKKAFYDHYLTTHNAHLYGEADLRLIHKSFRLWDFYYRSFFPQDKNCSLLDLGCGNGSFVHYLRSIGYSHVEGIDLSAEQIAEGEKLGIAGLVCGDVFEFLAGRTASYDCIIARDVIEHFDKNEALELIGLISKALKPNGVFIMQVPNGQGIYYTSIFFGDYTHEMAYTQNSVRQLFLNAGLSSSFCVGTGPAPISLTGLLRTWIWSLRVLQHRFWKWIETGSHRGIFTSNLIAVGKK